MGGYWARILLPIPVDKQLRLLRRLVDKQLITCSARSGCIVDCCCSCCCRCRFVPQWCGREIAEPLTSPSVDRLPRRGCAAVDHGSVPACGFGYDSNAVVFGIAIFDCDSSSSCCCCCGAGRCCCCVCGCCCPSGCSCADGNLGSDRGFDDLVPR